uniref:Peptidase M16 N-terminal domain-containing protein n=1 Tax=Megaselia scalaris TaxID=36166 RepID=T1GNW2_MEGSC
MACNASKTPFIRAIAKRGYAAQACPSPAGKTEIKSATLPNKLVVATASSQIPVTRVSVVFRAGSRNEEYETLGASHYLKAAAGLTTNNATTFGITRNIQQIGGNLTATNDRELVTVTVESTADKLDTALKFLDAAVTSPAFKPWELEDSIPRIRSLKKDGSAIDRAINLSRLRDTLGNSVYCPKHQIGKISSESLLHYFSQNCTTNRAAVVGVGIDQNVLQGFAQNLDLESGAGKMCPAKYHGGDSRKDKSGNLTHIALVGEGGSVASLKEALAFAILGQALGGGASTKRGNVNGPLGKAIAAAVGNTSASYSSYNVSYSDSGLCGAIMTVESGVAGKAIESAAKVLKSGSVSEQDFNRGKALLKAIILGNADCPSATLESLARQAAIIGDITSTSDIVSLIDSISKSDVDSAASKVARSKLSLGAVGNLRCVPYASDLA